MSASFTWDGLDEEYRDLKSLALDLAGDANELAQVHAMGAADAIGAAYPYRSGNLSTHVRVQPLRSKNAHHAGAYVANTAPHSHLYERGTVKRNFKGANRGRMPKHYTFVPRMLRSRKSFQSDLKAMLPKWGLEAKGNA